MTLKEHIRHSLTDQMGQSLAVLTKPSVATFERFERRGGVNEALFYVLLAAIFAALIAAFGSLIHSNLSFFGQFVSRLLTIPIQFGIFTGVVYWIAKQFFRGTGTYAEVAYTFALFFVPLSLVSSALGWIPVVGFFFSIFISLVLIYFGYLAVQSSMNIREGAQPALTLLAAAVITSVLNALLFGPWLASAFRANAPLFGL